MAFRAAKNWRLTLAQLGGGRRSFTTPTTPKLKPMSPAIDAAGHDAHSTSRMSTLKAEFAPVYIVCGMVCVAVAIGSHTAYQQLARSPTVHVNKKRRESMPEVSDPDSTINSASKFIDGSFLRKMSHIQDNKPTLHDPVHPNPFTRPRTAETLKTVGIEPKQDSKQRHPCVSTTITTSLSLAPPSHRRTTTHDTSVTTRKWHRRSLKAPSLNHLRHCKTHNPSGSIDPNLRTPPESDASATVSSRLKTVVSSTTTAPPPPRYHCAKPPSTVTFSWVFPFTLPPPHRLHAGVVALATGEGRVTPWGEICGLG
ncbi:NADH-ubiquinone reductase complex 1 MLRQ subunit [Spatholobus suberectus]|nr:NADH-ubiquinone reductase complex 1 MLRQ subunit [Spatholobus suberectus]